jgi:hypothetical protein
MANIWIDQGELYEVVYGKDGICLKANIEAKGWLNFRCLTFQFRVPTACASTMESVANLRNSASSVALWITSNVIAHPNDACQSIAANLSLGLVRGAITIA